ncbi:MAG: hypothetical protein BWY13_01103 [Euryarchaeota archaeon ADurb.Bin190]|jgi:hypothetical protein|nr:MAG: hypothetical protein BWY13_01103 [Euryarchaeota archaeon ADurb.Bin190]HNQ53947.1 hypothetical protein [Methanothrix sp.]HNU39175.1 hypothetical protein [Methanothrix sp.]HPA98458.1 hypothetical protein [Methanothrix sp.]
MKKTRISGKVALIALAAVCLLAVPALSMPLGDGSGRAGHGAMFDLKNNLTPEELDNMTLGELREMKMEAMNQSQFCQAGDRNCSQYCRGTKGQMGGNGPNGQMMGGNGPKGQMDGNGPNGQMMGRDSFQSGRCQGVGSDDGMGRMRGNPATLLMDDMDLEDLSNMTVAQVRDLIQTKMQELDNMTLSQIKQLELERMQKREKMTLSELREENGKRQEMAGILGLAAVRPEPVA